MSRAYKLAEKGASLAVEGEADGARIALPAKAPDPVVSVVVLKVEGAR